MSKQLTVAKEFAYNKIGSFRNANPYTIAFVYPQVGEACVIKGGLNDVKKYAEKNYPIAIVKYTFFSKGKHRGYYRFNGEKDGYYIRFIKSAPSYKAQPEEWGFPAKEGHRCQVSVSGPFLSGVGRQEVFKKELRRLPRRWMKELNPYMVNTP